MAITCKVCDTGEMKSASIYRMGRQVATMGFFVFYLSVAACALCVAGILMDKYGHQHEDLPSALAALVNQGRQQDALLWSGVGAVAGYVLVMKRKVLRCNGCGAVVDAG